MSSGENSGKDRDQNSQSSSDEDENQYDENDSFIQDDDDLDEEYVHAYRAYGGDSDKKKKKKEKKKEKKKIKHREPGDEFDDGDYEVLDGDGEDNNRGFKRLKKKEPKRKEVHNSQEQEDYIDDDFEDDIEDDNQRSQGGGYFNYQDMEYDEEISSIKEIMEGEEIFGAEDFKQPYNQPEDKEIVQFDIPERQFIQLQNHAKLSRRSIEAARKEFESDDKTIEGKWIYEKLKAMGFLQMYDEKLCKDKIKNVLEAIHKDHLEIMYIYYYRKKIYADVLTRELLWKIHELDEEWVSFKEQFQKLNEQMINVISSCHEVPKSLEQMFHRATETRILKYFKQYEQFVLSKINQDIQSKRNSQKGSKNSMVSQMQDRGIIQWLEKSGIFLSPHNLCFNLKNRMQDKKPKTPHTEPKQELERVFRCSNPQNDKVRYPLLVPEKRIQTICQYLEVELFSYPQLRKLLKDKYYKKLVITTQPTAKGNQDINLYSIFYPVKRIRDKPVQSLKKEVWILALEAQKLGLIKIDLKFEWELSSAQSRNFESDSVYLEMVKYYFDISTHKSGEIWNLFRKQVLTKMLENYFIPAFLKEVKEDLTKDGENQIIAMAAEKFKSQLMKGPSLKEGKPTKMVALVLEKQKFGMVFVDEVGEVHSPLQVVIENDEELKKFISDDFFSNYIKEHNPDMILISANCRRAQTLRKQLRNNSFTESIYSAFGEYEVPSLVARKKLIEGIKEQVSVLEAVSMARLKKNPMSEILSLWSDKTDTNGILSMNLHPFQSYIDKVKLKDSLEKVAIEVVNLVGLDLYEVIKHQHNNNQLQFVCGLGPRKAFDFMEKIKSGRKIESRKRLGEYLSGDIVYKNCSPFFKVQTSLHNALLQKVDKKKGKNYDEVNLLDMTRIPEEWFSITCRLIVQAIRSNSLLDIRQRKGFANLKDETIAMIQIFKFPEKIKGIQWTWKREQNPFFDEELVKSEIISRFKNPRDPERVMENKETFFNLLREDPDTLKRYMVQTVKVLSMKKNYLNVIVPENGLFGYIKLFDSKTEYEKGTFIKAILVGFPFDEKKYKDQYEDDQQLLKVEMALNFPHKTDERSSHDCFKMCFPQIVKEIHPLIDLQKDRFEIKKEDKPVIEVKEEPTRMVRTQVLRISHPKFRNISCQTAIELVKNEHIGDIVIRPSSEDVDFLTITWHFFKGVVAHIKLKSEQKSISNYVYRVWDNDRDKVFASLEDIIEKHIKPMNLLVQDVISNKKFLALSLDQIEQKVKNEMNRDQLHIHYFFACTEDYPQFFILVYIYKEKRPIKELIRVRSSGLYFHEQQFPNLKDLIIWFKEHLKQKDYQKYVKHNALKK